MHMSQVAEHYDSVLATDTSAEQLRHAVPHPKVRYLHTTEATPEEDLVAAVGGEGSVNLITVAEAAHWFDLPVFYAVANRVLRKPGGVIAVLGYNYRVIPVEDILSRFFHTAPCLIGTPDRGTSSKGTGTFRSHSRTLASGERASRPASIWSRRSHSRGSSACLGPLGRWRERSSRRA